MTASDAFFRRGTTKVYFLTTVTDTTLAEVSDTDVTGGTDLSDAIQGVSGWSENTARIPLPNLGSRKTFQINGEVTYPDSQLTLYDAKTTSTIRTALAVGTEGFIVIFPYGVTDTERCEVWPVECDGPDDQISVGNDAALTQYEFAITAEAVRDSAYAVTP